MTNSAEQFHKSGNYLQFLARTQLPHHLRGQLAPSDMMQQSVLRAVEAADNIQRLSVILIVLGGQLRGGCCLLGGCFCFLLLL